MFGDQRFHDSPDKVLEERTLKLLYKKINKNDITFKTSTKNYRDVIVADISFPSNFGIIIVNTYLAN